MQQGSSPPFSMTAETTVLGAIMIDRQALAVALEKVRPDDFYDPMNRDLFAAMIALFEKSSPIDVVTLTHKMDEMGHPGSIDRVGDLYDAVPSAANIEYHATIVHEKAILRRLLKASQDTVSDIFHADGNHAFGPGSSPQCLPNNLCWGYPYPDARSTAS